MLCPFCHLEYTEEKPCYCHPALKQEQARKTEGIPEGYRAADVQRQAGSVS